MAEALYGNYTWRECVSWLSAGIVSRRSLYGDLVGVRIHHPAHLQAIHRSYLSNFSYLFYFSFKIPTCFFVLFRQLATQMSKCHKLLLKWAYCSCYYKAQQFKQFQAPYYLNILNLQPQRQWGMKLNNNEHVYYTSTNWTPHKNVLNNITFRCHSFISSSMSMNNIATCAVSVLLLFYLFLLFSYVCPTFSIYSFLPLSYFFIGQPARCPHSLWDSKENILVQPVAVSVKHARTCHKDRVTKGHLVRTVRQRINGIHLCTGFTDRW